MYLDKNLIQLHKRNHPARAPPPPGPKHQLGHPPHLGPLLCPDFEPAFGAEEVGVGTKHAPVPPRVPDVGRDERAARHVLAVDGVAFGRDDFEGDYGGGWVQPQAFEDDSLDILSTAVFLLTSEVGERERRHTCRYGSSIASALVMGLEIFPVLMPSSIVLWRVVYTAAVDMI
jgi:hypothetical protein